MHVYILLKYYCNAQQNYLLGEKNPDETPNCRKTRVWRIENAKETRPGVTK